jgi:hypothetical protein
MTTPRGIGPKPIRTMTTLAAGALLAACASDFDANGFDPELDLGTVQQAAAACAGDDVNYDYNAFAASLAVAVANELGRWDANADFEVRNSSTSSYGYYGSTASTAKLELSTTGTMRCNASPRGCSNITAMLRLQDDAASSVPNHSPSIYRAKLVEWYQKQTRKLTELVDQRLTVDKGIYKMQVRHSGKYMAVDNGSTYDNAAIEQRGSVLQAGADEWRLILQNTKHRFQNVRSGKCLTLSSDSQTESVSFVQKTCSPLATTQNFDFAQTTGYYAIRNKWSMALDVNGASTADDARVMQYTWTGSKLNQQWKFIPVGTGAHIDPAVIATAVYSMTVRHSGKAIGVDNGSLAVGATIEQGTYSASDDRFQWYITQVGNKYQLINRRSGKCLALAADTSTGAVVQQVCAAVPTQLFDILPVGDGGHVINSKYERALEVLGASTNNDARIAQGANGEWLNHRILKLTPIVAGEPHTLTFSHVTDDATCGEHNFWYDIAQPNGDPLRAPADSFVQLIFAGGKETLTGKDVNPFIAQQVSGDLVAIDPTYGLNENNNTAVGLCTAACVKVSKTDVTGQCCSCSGVNKAYKKATWNATTFVCQ